MISKEGYADLGVFEGVDPRDYISDLTVPINFDDLTACVAGGQLYGKRDRIINAVYAVEKAFPNHDLVWDWEVQAHRLVEKRVREERIARESEINSKRLSPEPHRRGNNHEIEKPDLTRVEVQTILREFNLK